MPDGDSRSARRARRSAQSGGWHGWRGRRGGARRVVVSGRQSDVSVDGPFRAGMVPDDGRRGARGGAGPGPALAAAGDETRATPVGGRAGGPGPRFAPGARRGWGAGWGAWAREP